MGTGVPIPCAAGTYMNETQAGSCYSCPARFFCTNRVNPEPCSPGTTSLISPVFFVSYVIDRKSILEILIFKSFSHLREAFSTLKFLKKILKILFVFH